MTKMSMRALELVLTKMETTVKDIGLVENRTVQVDGWLRMESSTQGALRMT